MTDIATITQKVTEFINGELSEINNMGIGIFQKTLDNLNQQDFKYQDKTIFLQNIEAPKQINIAEDEKIGRIRFNKILQEYKKLEAISEKGNDGKSYTIQSNNIKNKPKIAIIILIGSVLNGWKTGDPPISELYKLSSEIKKNYTQKTELFDKIPTKLFDAINNFIDVLITFNNDLSGKIEAKKKEWKTLYESLKKSLVGRLKTIDEYLEEKKKHKMTMQISKIHTTYMKKLLNK